MNVGNKQSDKKPYTEILIDLYNYRYNQLKC